MIASTLTVRPLTTAIGTEICGLDLRSVDDETFAQIRRTLPSAG